MRWLQRHQQLWVRAWTSCAFTRRPLLCVRAVARLHGCRGHPVLPHVELTELLMEVDEWTGFTRHFERLKTAEAAPDKALVADRRPGRRHQPRPDQDGPNRAPVPPTPTVLVAGPARPLLAGAGRAGQRAVQATFRGNWGDGITSSSDGHRFKAAARPRAPAWRRCTRTANLSTRTCCATGRRFGWEHVDLTGDYLWRSSAKTGGGRFRPLRPAAGRGLAYVAIRF